MIIQSNIPIGIGDLFHIKAALDQVKHSCEEIWLTPHFDLLGEEKQARVSYIQLINDIGKLLFGCYPYKWNQKQCEFRSQYHFLSDYGLSYARPYFPGLLTLPNFKSPIAEKYLVVTTKVRELNYSKYLEIKDRFLNELNNLSKRYKIVLLGERDVEMNAEYQHHNRQSPFIFGIYNDLKKNLPSHRVNDLTIPAMGLRSSSTIDEFRRDCSVMNQAERVITFGIGGNFSMAVACSKVIGYRWDSHEAADYLYEKLKYDNLWITKDANQFLKYLANSI